jgi:hypothetical protein
MSLRSVRTAIDGGIIFSLQVPPDIAPQVWAPLVHSAGYPLAVTIEVIDIDDMDGF